MKTTIKITIIFLLFFCCQFKLYALQGEPVPGAEVFVELEPDDQPIVNNPTNEGNYNFHSLPKGTYNLYVVLPTLAIQTNEINAKKIFYTEESGYDTNSKCFLLNNKTQLCQIQLLGLKNIDINSIKNIDKKSKSKPHKAIAILKFTVTQNGGKINLNLGSIPQVNYKSLLQNFKSNKTFSAKSNY